MKTYEVLEKALALIEDEKNWVPRMGSYGGPHCIVTATNWALNEAGMELGGWRWTETPWGFALSSVAGGDCAEFNDSHTHAEVVALFQEAIRNEKAKEGIPLDVEVEVPA